MHVSTVPLKNDFFEAFSLDDAQYAFFCDVDGTLIDLAPTPDSVIVSDDLVFSLQKLDDRLTGAVALVTGRPLEFIEQQFPFFSGAIAGLHGTEFRLPSGEIERLEPGEHFRLAKDFLNMTRERVGDLLLEDKGNAIALHYRNAPHLEDVAHELMTVAQRLAGPEWRVQPGKYVFELRSRNGDKGAALRRLMQCAPFAGRVPLAFGDDLTDIPMLEAATALGGQGIAIGETIRGSSSHALDSPAALRAWIAGLAES
ncbi:trehalose-phosphatase [Brucella sp. BE17]|uniref:trehalose-phosphatase n=1 Tax=Brucella sp. BE17 TaxID=3142977 RepID=UPI0031B9D7FB